jgi:hypothetical protein
MYFVIRRLDLSDIFLSNHLLYSHRAVCVLPRFALLAVIGRVLSHML